MFARLRMPPRLARWLYSLTIYLLSPLIWWRVWREWLPTHPRRERLGLPAIEGGRPRIWLHAASVGEVVTATPLIRALLEDHPDHDVVVTTMTATGAERVRKTFGDQISHHFLPLDFPGSARRFVSRLNPRLAVIAETELWPNLLAACQRRDVPVVIANGRLSAGAFRLYRRFGALSRGMMEAITWIGAKSPEDSERFLTLGAPPARVSMTGALKFDLAVDDTARDASRQLRDSWGRRPVWVAGSIHPGEDEQILIAHAALKSRFPGALLILVPRHPQRFDEVDVRCRAAGEQVVRFSARQPLTAQTTLLLGDTMGDLMMFYGCGDVAFVGGSLVPVGGHNLLEPAALGVPVISGPFLDNLREIADSLAASEARIEIENGEALGESLLALFGDDDRRHRLGEAGRAVVEANRGALQRTRRAITATLDGDLTPDASANGA